MTDRVAEKGSYMTDNTGTSSAKRHPAAKSPTGSHSGSFIYLLGFIGALVYYLHFHSGSLWLVILAALKAFVWPALLTYHLLVFLHM